MSLNSTKSKQVSKHYFTEYVKIYSILNKAKDPESQTELLDSISYYLSQKPIELYSETNPVSEYNKDTSDRLDYLANLVNNNYDNKELINIKSLKQIVNEVFYLTNNNINSTVPKNHLYPNLASFVD